MFALLLIEYLLNTILRSNLFVDVNFDLITNVSLRNVTPDFVKKNSLGNI